MMIQRVGEMLAFQSYNIKSPLNGRAAQWVEEHLGELPVDKGELFVYLSQEPPPATAESAACANCGATGVPLRACDQGHGIIRPDCVVLCPTQQHVLCLACGTKRCRPCTVLCANCGADAALGEVCPVGHPGGCDCRIPCPTCQRVLCLICGPARAGTAHQHELPKFHPHETRQTRADATLFLWKRSSRPCAASPTTPWVRSS